MKKVQSFLTLFLPPFLLFVFLTATAEWITSKNLVPAYLFPSPSSIWHTLKEDSAEYFFGILKTSMSAFSGFALSAVLGVTLAVVFASSRWALRAVHPYVVFFQTVPIIAIAPLLVIWFGYGPPTVIAAAFIVSVFPVIASTLVGLRSTEPALLDLFQLYGASSLQTLFKLRFPFALPQILTGLKVAGGLAVIGAVVGEFITGGGIGSIIDAARSQQRIDKVFAAVACSAFLGLSFFITLNVLSSLLLRHWHSSEKKQ